MCLKFFVKAKPSAQQLIGSDLPLELTPLQQIKVYAKESGGMKLHEVNPSCLNNHGLLTEDLQTIREVTKDQSSNETWFEMRNGMMIVSNFYRIKSRCNTLHNNPETTRKTSETLAQRQKWLGRPCVACQFAVGRKIPGGQMSGDEMSVHHIKQ